MTGVEKKSPIAEPMTEGLFEELANMGSTKSNLERLLGWLERGVEKSELDKPR